MERPTTIGAILDKIYTESNYEIRLRIGNKRNTNEPDGVYLGFKCILLYPGIFDSVCPKSSLYDDIKNILSKPVLKTHSYKVMLIECE